MTVHCILTKVGIPLFSGGELFCTSASSESSLLQTAQVALFLIASKDVGRSPHLLTAEDQAPSLSSDTQLCP